MDTDKLMKFADDMVAGLFDGPDNKDQELACAQIYALLAIANELKRMNDSAEAESEREHMIRLYSE